MNASMFVASWSDVPLPREHLAALVQRSSADRSTEAPSGFAHHGVGGEALSVELARMLSCPAFDQAASATFVPCAIEGGVERHEIDGAVHLVIGAERLRATWPAERDEAYRRAVAEACRAVRRGAPSAMEHVLWLEHFLIERLLRVAAPLRLPVVIIWPERRPSIELERMLDGALSSWGD